MRGSLAVIRADATPAVGAGHVRRCLAFASALRLHDWRTAFATTPETAAVVAELGECGGEVAVLAASEVREPGALARRWPEGTELLVVDHYGLGFAFESACRGWARRILVLDDEPRRRHEADLLVDPTPLRSPKAWAGRVPEDCDLVLGPMYAPLRPEFAAAAGAPEAVNERRLFIGFGATDPADATGAVLDALLAHGLPGDVRIEIALGRAAPALAEVEDRVRRLGGRARLSVEPGDMAAVMRGATLAIGAGGGASWERCALGLPSVVLVIADNQRGVATALERTGAARLAASSEDAARLALVLLEDEAARVRLGRAARRLCDGRGALRIAGRIAPPRARDGKPVRLRPAMLEDGERMLRWQGEPGTRRYARNPAVPSAEEHRAWLESRLGDPDSVLNVVEHGARACGVVRLDRQEPAVWEVSVYIAAATQGQGIAKAALELAHGLVPQDALTAEVHPDNRASHALFRAAGYRLEGGRYLRPPLAAARNALGACA